LDGFRSAQVNSSVMWLADQLRFLESLWQGRPR
jgi:hypothetical protein